jgi:hypothetical protein
MKRIWISMVAAAAALAMTACGGKVVVDGLAGGGGAGGSGGAPGTPTTCPSDFPQDDQVMNLLGKTCIPADQICASNNGCGGCSVTCKGGVWTSTDADLCFSVGGAC